MGLLIKNGALGAENLISEKMAFFFAKYYGFNCIAKLGSEYHYLVVEKMRFEKIFYLTQVIHLSVYYGHFPLKQEDRTVHIMSPTMIDYNYR